jgi:hypothetical protein
MLLLHVFARMLSAEARGGQDYISPDGFKEQWELVGAAQVHSGFFLL